MVIRFPTNAEGVPGAVVVVKRITPQEYLENMTAILSEAKAQGVCVGDTHREPTAFQKGWLARVMNAVGFYHPQWMKFIHKTEDDHLEAIQEEEDGDTRDTIILDIVKRLYTRQSA